MRIPTCHQRHVPPGQLTAPPGSPDLVRNSLQTYSINEAIFIPTILFEPVFHPAKFGSWVRNREDAISSSEH
jgi:hypothetical protein